MTFAKVGQVKKRSKLLKLRMRFFGWFAFLLLNGKGVVITYLNTACTGEWAVEPDSWFTSEYRRFKMA